MTNHRWGFHHGTLSCRDLVLDNDITISGDMTFGDASADTLTVTGTATFGAATTFSNTVAISGVTTAKNSLSFASTGTLTNAIALTGTVTNVLDFDATDGTSGAKTGAACDTTSASDGAVKIDINGTAHYIPYYTAAHTTGSW